MTIDEWNTINFPRNSESMDMTPFHYSQYGHHNTFKMSKEKCKIKSFNTKHSSARGKRQSGDYFIYLSNITYDPQNKVLLLFPASPNKPVISTSSARGWPASNMVTW